MNESMKSIRKIEQPESLQSLNTEELYKSLRESYHSSIHGNEEIFDAREVI